MRNYELNNTFIVDYMNCGNTYFLLLAESLLITHSTIGNLFVKTFL